MTLASPLPSELHDMVGTPAYMAPEQLLEGATISSDVYSLGLVLFEMFTGAPAFVPGGAADRVRGHAGFAAADTVAGAARHRSGRGAPDRSLPRLHDPARRPALSLAPSRRRFPGAILSQPRLPRARLRRRRWSRTPRQLAACGRRSPGHSSAALVIGLGTVAAINDRVAVFRPALVQLSPEVLRLRAQADPRARRLELLLRPIESPASNSTSTSLRTWAATRRPKQWRRAESGPHGLLRFWYRESDAWLTPWSLVRWPSSADPPARQSARGDGDPSIAPGSSSGSPSC